MRRSVVFSIEGNNRNSRNNRTTSRPAAGSRTVGATFHMHGDLAIPSEFKEGTLYSVEFMVKPGVGVREGSVGSMWDANAAAFLPGGGRQATFMQGRPATNPELFQIIAASIRELK